jgi:hypothetical protein
MHRDVSAGNCLLTRNQEGGPSFVADLELAKKLHSKTSGGTISVRSESLSLAPM